MRICQITTDETAPGDYDLGQAVVLENGDAHAYSKTRLNSYWYLTRGMYKIVMQLYPSVGRVAHESKQNPAEAAPLTLPPNFISVLERFKNFSIEAELK